MKSFDGVVPSLSTTSQRIQGPILLSEPWSPHSPLSTLLVSSIEKYLGGGGGGVLDLDLGGGDAILTVLSWERGTTITYKVNNHYREWDSSHSR